MVKRGSAKNNNDLILTVGAVVLGLGVLHLLNTSKRSYYAYAAAPCSAACNPFKNSPGTYATCCKQHAATAAIKPPIRPATPAHPPIRPAPGAPTTLFQKANPLPVVKSKAPKPSTTGALHQGQVTFADYMLPNNGPLDLFKGRSTSQNGTQAPTSNQTSTGQPSDGGGSMPAGIVAPASITGMNGFSWGIEPHTFASGKGCSPNDRETATQKMMGNNAGVSLVVELPRNQTSNDEITPSIGGPPHSGGNDNYTGYKFRIAYGPGASKAPIYTDEYRHQYNNYGAGQKGVSAGKGYQAGDVIKPGGKYGIVVTKKNNGNAVDLSLWFQDFSKDNAPRNILNVHDTGQFGHPPFTGESGGEPITSKGNNIIDIRRDCSQKLRSITAAKQFTL